MPAQIVPVIMCGGAGTRLWPVSRESMPKQFVPLVGQGSTFQQVLARISHPDLFTRPIVITSADFRFVVAEQLRERGVEADIVLEPMRRDSGLAVAVSALLAAERDRNALVLVLAADHVVRKPDEFRAACERAAAVAAEGRIVTFGIEPTHPATSYGYIRPGEKLNGASARAVEAFVEKPDAATAAARSQAARNSSGLRTTWSAANTSTRALRLRSAASRAETATARPESRRIGSSTMSASTPRSRNCSATTKRNSALVMTIGRANKSGCEMRASTCWNVDPCPTRGTNCLGMLSRETGHSRVPAPPHMITGTI